MMPKDADRAAPRGQLGLRVKLPTAGFAESILGAGVYESIHMVNDDALTPLSSLVTDQTAREELEELEKGTMLRRLPSLAAVVPRPSSSPRTRRDP
jgi:hypothetical protein